ncbi:phage tail protein [Streptomyces uncialis]|uniref:phage tail protein n=1 Tax=Streptomyces uncialis TaxID=1048205 RepID=UPI00225B38EC|nr:phage tail protein [Streptomyces uncialis]MCX4661501.1 phage tail protein [Streptomyces uncialis]
MPAADWNTLAALKRRLVRKALSYAIFIADTDTVTLTAPFDTGGVLQTLPAGYQPIGYTDDSGITWSGDYSLSEVASGQSAKPVRADVETDTVTAQFVPIETNAASTCLFEDLPLSSLGEVGTPWDWSRPMVPATIYRRMVAIARDTTEGGTDPIYIVRHLPLALRSERGEEQWVRTEAISREVTMAAYHDDGAGTDSRTWVDGPGWRALGGTSSGGGGS